MRKMKETGCASVVQYIAYRRYIHDQVHRIYMEYCPHGDLKRLYKRCRKFRFVRVRDEIVFEVLTLNRLYMPEPFLWDVFHQLVETAVAMRYGPVGGGWDHYEIVHRDIKPANSSTPGLFPFLAAANQGQSSWTLRTERAGSLSTQQPNWATGDLLGSPMPMILTIQPPFILRELRDTRRR